MDFNIALFIFSFFAGILTVFAPCVFTLLPVVLCGSTAGASKDYKRGYIIVLSLVASVFIFTLLLRVSTAFISIPISFWQGLSGFILIVYGIILLFPQIWDFISVKTGFLNSANKKFFENSQRKGFLGSVLVGISLGPVFSACSPTYSLIITTVFQENFIIGLIYLIAYCFGLGILLLLIALLGQALVQKLKWAVNPHGIFKRVLGILFVLIGLLIFLGLDKQLEIFLLDNGLFDTTQIERSFLQNQKI